MPYEFSPPFNGVTMLDDAPGLLRCPDCAMPRNKWDTAGDLSATPFKSPHVSTTVDGFDVASKAFQARYIEEGWHGLTFRPLARGYAEIRAKRIVRVLREDRFLYDRSALEPGIERMLGVAEPTLVVRNHTQSCATCGTYRQVLGGGPLVIARGQEPIGDREFVQVDFELGEGDSLSIPWIVGDGIHAAHRRKKIRGVSVFNPVRFQPWAARDGGQRFGGNVIDLAAHRP